MAIHVKGESDEAARYRFTLVRYLNLCVILWVKNIENDIDFRDLIETGLPNNPKLSFIRSLSLSPSLALGILIRVIKVMLRAIRVH